MKKFIILVALSLIFSLMVTSTATVDLQADAANHLYQLGLFKGTGTDEQGVPVFELERAPTRAEALVMLLRLTGCDLPDYAPKTPHPFTDIPLWAEHYVAYAYDNGLTKGVSDTLFGTGNTATAGMYVTFMLRALGYSDSGEAPDFNYAGAVDFGNSLGLTQGVDLSSPFTRGGAAIISQNALSQPVNGGNETLKAQLVSRGVISQAADGKTISIRAGISAAEYSYGKSVTYTFQCAALRAAFPRADRFIVASDISSHIGSDRYSHEELAFFYAITYGKPYSRDARDTGTISAYGGVYNWRVYVVDAQYHVLAWVLLAGDDHEMVRFNVGSDFDGAKLFKEYCKITDTVDKNYGKNVFELDSGRYGGWDDGDGITYARPIKMNGKYMDAGWFSGAWYGDDIGREEGMVDRLKESMADVFFFSDHSREYSTGEKLNPYLIDGGDVWTIDSSGGAPVSRGVAVRDAGPELLVVIFTPKGEYLGHLIIPER